MRMLEKVMNIWRTPTISALSPSSEGLSRQFPVQYIGSGESQRSIGDIVLPYHDSFFVLSDEMKSDFFDLVLIFAWSKVPGGDPDRRDTSIPKRRISLKKWGTIEYCWVLTGIMTHLDNKLMASSIIQYRDSIDTLMMFRTKSVLRYPLLSHGV